ncbi:MAG: lysylphosphatidylglycerol synthase transmembrane domain-containing protein [Candidatus Aureabacteria bacterium]|nr:lysylphosphatidylglycerol synthase transmembrane domain-containing protein [Candidatus Auribacterota bacterium]
MIKGRYIGSLVSGAIVIVIAFTFDWHKVVSGLRGFHYVYLFPAVILYLAGFVFRGIRWQYMLAPLKRIPFASSFSVVMIGFMANNILPLRMGEFVRAWAIRKKEGISGSAGFATIVIERVYDGLALIGLFVVVLLFSTTTPEIKRYAAMGASVFVVALGVLLYAAFREEAAARFLKRITRLLPGTLHARVSGLIDSFMPGLHFLSSGRQQAAVIFYSLLIWCIEGGVFWLVMQGFHLAAPAYAAFATLVIVNIAIMVPAGPGYVGTFDLAAVVALAPFGIGKNAAMGYIFIVHALQYVSVTALGLYYMNASGWSLRQIEDAERS